MHASVAKASTHGHRSRSQAPAAARRDRPPRHRASRPGAPVRREVEAEHGRRPPPRRRGRRAGARVASRRAGARDRGSRAGRRGGRARSAQRLPDEHGGARRVPVGGDRQREPALLQRRAEPKRARAREAAAAAERPAHPLRVGGDANGEGRPCGGGDAVAAERDVANRDREPPASAPNGSRPGRRRPAGARRRPAGTGRPRTFPFQTIVSSVRGKQRPERAPLSVDEQHAATGLAQPVGDVSAIAPPVAVGRDHARSDR